MADGSLGLFAKIVFLILFTVLIVPVLAMISVKVVIITAEYLGLFQ